MLNVHVICVCVVRSSVECLCGLCCYVKCCESVWSVFMLLDQVLSVSVVWVVSSSVEYPCGLCC